MADAIKNIVLGDSHELYGIHLTNVSDGTGESAVIKIDKSTLLAKDGAEPASLDIVAARWNVQGFPRVIIAWDHTTDDTALVLAGSGYDEFTGLNSVTAPGLKDPRSTGGAGDIVLTAPAGATTGSYDITLWVYKNPD